MNKLKLKKFLTLLVCLMLIASMTLLAACNKETGTEEEEKPATATPTFTNGNFTNFASSDTYPKSPSSWTKSPTGDQSSATDGYSFVVSDIVGGIISLDSETYEANKSNWNNLAIFPKNTEGLSEDYTADDDVLMLYNKVKAYQTYTSTATSATANSYYKLSVDVRTHAIDGKGATISLYDAANSHDVILATFTGVISNDTWTRYTFYFKTKTTSSSLALKLSLGNDEIGKIKGESVTSGYAFFDNVQMTAITADTDNNKTAAEVYNTAISSFSAEELKTNQSVDLAIPNGTFDFVKSFSATNSNPALYERVSDSNEYHAYNRVSLGADYAAYMATVGVTVGEGDNGPGLAGNIATRYNYAYVLNAKANNSTALGFRTYDKLVFKRGTAYAVSVYVNAAAMTAGNATVALTAGFDEIATDDLTYNVAAGTDGWKKLTFIVLPDQNTATELYFQMWLTKNGETAPAGYAFFDNLEITAIDLSDKENGLAGWQSELGVDADHTLDKTITEDKSLIDNRNISGGNANGGSVRFDDGKTNILNNVDNSTLTKSIVDVRLNDADDSAYTTVSNYVMKLVAGTPTIYGLGYNTVAEDARTIESLKPFTAYRFSAWVKTVDVQATAGINLTVYDGIKNEAIATFTNINTASIPEAEGLFGYRELVCYIYTAEKSEQISFEITLGSGTQLTPTTLFDGTGYISNVSLTEVEYSKFSSASAGTYIKKKNYNTTTDGTFTNGQFENVNRTDTKGFTGDANDGKVEDEFQKTAFGVPESWALSKDKSLDNMPHVYAGIVDINRAQLIANLKAAAGLTETYGETETAVVFSALSAYDFTSLLYRPESGSMSAEDFLKYSAYATGNSALMLAAPDAAYPSANFASMNYTTKDEVSLSADSYYEISVLVKTVGKTNASVYLTSDKSYEMNSDAKFENISNTADETVTNGWKKYTFFVKVGFSAVDVQLKLCLGQTDDATDTLNDGASVGGIAFFDAVEKISSTEEKYNAALASEDDSVVAIALDTDSFGSTKSSTSTGPKYRDPATSTWLGTADATAGDSNKFGIVIHSVYDFDQYAEDLKDILVGNSGDSCLVINNNEAGAYHFTSGTGKTFKKAGYYKVSVYVKTWGVEEGKNAFVRLDVSKYTKADEGENKILVNTLSANSYQLVEFYVKAPEKTDLTTAVKLTLGLGEEDALVNGIAVFDDVKFEVIDEAAYTAATTDTNDFTSAVVYNDIDSTIVDPDKDPTDPAETKDDYRWIIFTSVAFGAVLIIIVAIYFFKKYLPKRKIKTDLTKKPKKGDKDVDKGEYDNLQD